MILPSSCYIRYGCRVFGRGTETASGCDQMRSVSPDGKEDWAMIGNEWLEVEVLSLILKTEQATPKLKKS